VALSRLGGVGDVKLYVVRMSVQDNAATLAYLWYLLMYSYRTFDISAL